MIEETLELLFSRRMVHPIKQPNGDIYYRFNGYVFKSIEDLRAYLQRTFKEDDFQ